MNMNGFTRRDTMIMMVLLLAFSASILMAIETIKQKQKETHFFKELEQAVVVLQAHAKEAHAAPMNLAKLVAIGALPPAAAGPFATPWGSPLKSVTSGRTFTTLTFEWSGIRKECTAIDTVLRDLGLTGLVSSLGPQGEKWGGQIGLAVEHAAGHRHCEAALPGQARALEIDLNY